MVAWALLLLTLVVAALAGYEGYDQLEQTQAKLQAAQTETADLKTRCQTDHATSAALLEAAKAENLKLVQERGELAAARDEASRAAKETGAALQNVRSQHSSRKKR